MAKNSFLENPSYFGEKWRVIGREIRMRRQEGGRTYAVNDGVKGNRRVVIHIEIPLHEEIYPLDEGFINFHFDFNLQIQKSLVEACQREVIFFKSA